MNSADLLDTPMLFVTLSLVDRVNVRLSVCPDV